MSQTEDCEDGAYEVLPPAIEEIEMKVNPTYGVATTHEKTSEDNQKRTACYSIKMIMVLVAVPTFAVAAACIAFALEISNLKTKIASTQDFARLENSTLSEILNTNLTELNSKLEIIKSELQTLRHLNQGQSEMIPASSCAALPLSSPSGYYWVRASNGSAVCVYCDMTRSCGGVTGGWMRLTELDMTNSSHQCPSGLIERTIPPGQTEPRTCASTNTLASCSDGTFFDAILTSYTKVCGKIIGYQIGGTNGFDEPQSIDSYYVDGVSLTHGIPRQHIWTFAAARDATISNECPGDSTPPDFVGSDYFCDTGASTLPDSVFVDGLFFPDNPLWDCEAESMNCDSSSPPWFYKQLPQPTTSNIEMRVCRNERAQFEDVAIESIELYVQ